MISIVCNIKPQLMSMFILKTFQSALLLAMIASLLISTNGFLLDDKCFGVCYCRSNSIDCMSSNLQTFPVFNIQDPSRFVPSVLFVYLKNNNLSEIPSGVFRNFTNIQGVDSLTLDLREIRFLAFITAHSLVLRI